MTQEELERVEDLDCILDSYLTYEDTQLLERAVDIGLGAFYWDTELDDAVFSINYRVLENLRWSNNVGAYYDAD